MAGDALDRGELERARTLARQAAALAVEQADRKLEAEALLVVARAEASGASLRNAHEAAHRAAHLFGVIEDPCGEVRALVWLAYAASCLRHNEVALAAAMLAARLAAPLADLPLRVSALNCLGIALIASGDFERSDVALRDASALAEQAGHVQAALQSVLNRCYGEIVRVTVERHLYDRPADPARLTELLEDWRRLRPAWVPGSREPVRRQVWEAMASFAECFSACWQGDVGTAREHAARVSSAGGCSLPGWLDALAGWTNCEVAWSTGDLPLAEASVRCMIDSALRVEHEQIARTGYMLASRILDAQGRGRDALRELRLLAQRDIAIRRGSYEHHERVAAWQLELRASSMRVRSLEATSKSLERLSLEDALTGLSNRRHFEREVGRLLRGLTASSLPLSIALIDVDRFKEINDAHSHLVGDRVLKVIAGLLTDQVRHDDLPARLGGDEFVVLFRDADVRVAAAACERLQQAVARYPWLGLAAGMEVRLSIGLAQAVVGDSIESLLERSDAGMYRAKSLKR